MELNRKTIAVVAGAAALAGVAGLGIGAALDDPSEEVGVVNLSDTEAGGTTAQGSSTEVPALDELSGTVRQDDDDLVVDGVELDFGPDEWVATAPAGEDLDGDGTAEPLRAELDGLVGRDVELRVLLDADGDDADVYLVDGRTYRAVGGPAPWQPAGAVGEDEVRAAAAGAVGEGARVTDLEAEDGPTVFWEAEVVDRDGREHDVTLGADGEVLDVRAD